jgi:hypothetical protein
MERQTLPTNRVSILTLPKDSTILTVRGSSLTSTACQVDAEHRACSGIADPTAG